jgi:SAM-dependent methyltransferase
MSYISPYMHDVPEQNTKRGKNIINTIIKFIEKKDLGKTLDIGERNPLTEILENYYAIKIENTNVDLDVEKLSGKYDTIFCFEVIEHLYNPLHLLLEIHKILNDKGQLYLSTPKGKPHFLWFKHHFHEIYEPELRSLFIRAGFTISRLKYFRVIPIWKGFAGFRPFIRMLFQRKCMVELIK